MAKSNTWAIFVGGRLVQTVTGEERAWFCRQIWVDGAAALASTGTNGLSRSVTMERVTDGAAEASKETR